MKKLLGLLFFIIFTSCTPLDMDDKLYSWECEVRKDGVVKIYEFKFQGTEKEFNEKKERIKERFKYYNIDFNCHYLGEIY